jgi:hypothetical protein
MQIRDELHTEWKRNTSLMSPEQYHSNLSINKQNGKGLLGRSYSTVTCMSDSRQGFGLDIRFTDHFNTQLVITFNYSVIANLRTLKITRAHANSFPSRSVFTSGCLVPASNNGCFQAAPYKEN